MSNIVRDPLFRRNHTSLSEDPFLNAQLGAAEIMGIQSRGAMAQVKHFAGYNGSDDIAIDERTLHEIYLPAFEAAVKAGAASVMCAYSKVNGVWSCENAELQNLVLRKRWGFNGFVTSDWGAVHSPLAITQGLDLEMPGRPIAFRGGPVLREGLKPLVETAPTQSPPSIRRQPVSSDRWAGLDCLSGDSLPGPDRSMSRRTPGSSGKSRNRARCCLRTRRALCLSLPTTWLRSW